jgi:hypothetical protein
MACTPLLSFWFQPEQRTDMNCRRLGSKFRVLGRTLRRLRFRLQRDLARISLQVHCLLAGVLLGDSIDRLDGLGVIGDQRSTRCYEWIPEGMIGLSQTGSISRWMFLRGSAHRLCGPKASCNLRRMHDTGKVAVM